MKKILSDYISLLPMLLFLTYTLGYINLKIFYIQLGIDIEYYITLTDLFFYTINILIVFGLVQITLFILTQFISLSFLTVFLSYKYKNIFEERLKSADVNSKFIQLKSNHNIFIVQVLLIILILIIFAIITQEFFYVFSVGFISLFMVMFSLLPEKSVSQKNIEKGKLRDRDYFFVMVYFVLLILNLFQGNSKAKEIDNNVYYFRKPRQVEFVSNDSVYSTTLNKSLKFVGETTGYLFLYDTSGKKSLVFNKGDISNLRIVNPTEVSSANVKYYFDLTALLSGESINESR